MKIARKLRMLQWIALLLVVPSHLTPADGQQQQQAGALVNRAASSSNIRYRESAPFQLRLQVHVQGITPKTLDGSYEEWWGGSDRWRRAISMAGFTQVETADKDGRWFVRSLDFRPHAIHLILDLVNTAVSPRLYSAEQVLRVHDQKKEGVKLRCVIAKRDVFQRTLCFDDRGLLRWVEVTDTKIHHRFEYSDYDKFGDRQFPHSMRVLENGHSVIEARAEDLSVLAAGKPDFFAHSQDAQRISGCDSPEPEKVVKKVPPHYPSEARAAYVQGTNLMYVMVAEDGTVSNVRVLQTAGAALDDASVLALKQWTYRPAMCGANPVPIETEVSMSYTLN